MENQLFQFLLCLVVIVLFIMFALSAFWPLVG